VFEIASAYFSGAFGLKITKIIFLVFFDNFNVLK
jgi:hypothetical protein